MRNAVSSLSSRRKAPPGRGISPRLFYGITALLLVVNAGLGLALAMHGDIARLLAPAADRAISVYETRIADLRTEIDRLNSRQYVREGDINLQLRDLVQQQEDLAEQQQVVKSLTRMAEDLGLVAADSPAPQPAAAPRPGTASLSLTDIGTSLSSMENENAAAMTSLAALARTASDKVAKTLNTLGIPTDAPAGIGGPLVTVSAASTTPLVDTANAVALQLRRYAGARDAAADAPVHRPLVGSLRMTSPYGVRTDPFAGEDAFHTGMDMAAATGTDVLSTGAGRVTFAGERSGYGILVEIDHGDGIVSRYGHLSRTLVTEGEAVVTGTVIGRSGSTGRSTGPHLHFEMRRGGRPVDPNAFLKAGRTLQAIL